MQEGLRELETLITEEAYVFLDAERELDQKLKLLGKRQATPKKGEKVKPPLPITLKRREIRKCRLDYEGRIALLERTMEEARENLENFTKNHPLWSDFLEHVKGFGPHLTGLLIAVIGDIEKIDSPSGLWKSFGLDVDNETGRIRKPKAGEQGKVGFGPARQVLGRIRISIFKIGKLYGGWFYEYYLEQRSRYEREHPDWSEGRQMGAAIVKMEKILLALCYKVLREAHGLPARDPYILMIPPHSRVIRPEDVMEEKKKPRAKRSRHKIDGSAVAAEQLQEVGES